MCASICVSPAGCSIGGEVWLDANADGLQAAGEVGQAGTTVRLLQDTTTIITTTTDAAGRYTFSALPPGTYAVQVVQPPGLVFSPQTAGTADARGSEVDPANGKSAPFALTSGEAYAGPHAGLYQGLPPTRPLALAPSTALPWLHLR